MTPPTPLKCPTCPVTSGICLGETVSRLCCLARSREDYRRLLVTMAAGDVLAETPPGDAGLKALGLVSACPARGSVLPLKFQPECGCAELSECRRDKGKSPGRVTLRECLACVEMPRGGS